jgi:hypothetical protein
VTADAGSEVRRRPGSTAPQIRVFGVPQTRRRRRSIVLSDSEKQHLIRIYPKISLAKRPLRVRWYARHAPPRSFRPELFIVIRKMKSGKYRLYSRKLNGKTGKRRNLGTFSSLSAAREHERDIQYFKRHG